MPRLRTVLESLDELDEAYHDAYQQNDHGEFVLQLEDVDSHPTVRGLRTALDTAKSQREKYRRELAVFQPIVEAVGDDGDLDTTVHDLVARMGDGGGDNAEDIEAQVKARAEARIKAMERKHEREIEEARGRATTFEKALHKKLVEAEIDAGLEKAGVRPEARPALRALMKEKGPKVMEVGDGEFKGVFPTDIHGVPEANQPIGDYIGDWAKTEEAKFYLPSTGAGGSGSPPSQGGGGAPGGRKTFTSRQLQEGDFDIEAVAKGEATVSG